MMRIASFAAIAAVAQLDVNGGVAVDALKLTMLGKPAPGPGGHMEVVHMMGINTSSLPDPALQAKARAARAQQKLNQTPRGRHAHFPKNRGQTRGGPVLKGNVHTPVEGYYNPKGTWCVKLSKEEVSLREELGLPAHASATAAQKKDAESKSIKWGADGWYLMDEETSYLLPVSSYQPKVISNGFKYNLTHWKFRNLPGVINGNKLYLKRTTINGRDERLVRKL